MLPKFPHIVKWLLRPTGSFISYFKRVRKRLQTFLYNITHKEKRARAYRTIRRIGRKIAPILTMLFLSYQVFVERGWRRDAEKKEALAHESEFFWKQRVNGLYRDWDDAVYYVWEKLKSRDRFIMLNVNLPYARKLLWPMGLREVDYMGRTDFDIFEREIAQSYYKEDSIVAITGDTLYSLTYGQLKSGRRMAILSIKWRDIRRLKDTIVRGTAIPLEKILNEIEKESTDE